MRRFLQAIKCSLARKRNRFYSASEKSLMYLHREKSLRILLTEKPQWEDDIRRGFRGSPHRLEFGSLSQLALGEFDLVVPLEISSLIQARQWSHLLAKNPIPIPSKESILLCDDKYRFNQALIDRGFGSYIPRMGTGLPPPYILKKRVGEWGKECWMIRDHEAELRVLHQLNDSALYRQEIIRGRYEFATHILFARGKIIKSLNIMYEFESEIPIKGQDDPLYKVICKSPYLELFANILSSIGFEGLCCVNYKVAGGQPYILEINPRFGGSLGPYFFSFIRHLNSG